MNYSTIQVGDNAEQRALDYLILSGLSLISRNVASKLGEIDLIMQDGAVIVFIEVRKRNHIDFSSALESIDSCKQRKIMRTAELFLQQHPRFAALMMRFDVVVLNQNDDLRWIKNAFTES